LLPVDELLEHTEDTANQIARRAFEIFESRGGVHGQDCEDWLLAESELLKPMKFSISESGEPVTGSAGAKPGTSRRLLQEPTSRSSERKQHR
ncbi:MAG: DUF2934 domain-containing protein, partial [Candidatus Acidiferrales bacterium]